ncbi:helix-turn-helix domain-containing protein [Pantoea agglomerans]|uniref:helix-turn-helix domain-containing protein n=1 Tax=Enterobacter agglomerans TaxID=549 RepID=UPI0010C1B16C|nr:helix-turn-helix domain-containing protein [Pantoea agglomerans]MBD8145401.1 helix-turn-helix domain-containing protein [Pantoea agglomerans]MBD8184370.1 helix-turn-helix domain-containing protein [Pantoea agglomerans]MBD8223156.1 helix-turn-helix domain-containing protein [Pantoea agglomerans]TKJ54183.1 hypothetical protein PagCFBP13505_20450 [Pantoea agglomerans]TKK14544.1 hypothetical protein PagCFBP13516_21570 [Pantoea agglomerans]
MKIQEEIIYSLIQWIETNLERKLSIGEVAERAGYSKWHLQRLFRSVTRYGLAEYIRSRKLEAARQCLISEEASIIDIATMYGFSSQQSFTRVFVNRYRITPGRYRKMVRDLSVQPAKNQAVEKRLCDTIPSAHPPVIFVRQVF